MKTFYAILGNSLAASVVNNFVRFAVTFWVAVPSSESRTAAPVQDHVFAHRRRAKGMWRRTLQ